MTDSIRLTLAIVYRYLLLVSQDTGCKFINSSIFLHQGICNLLGISLQLHIHLATPIAYSHVIRGNEIFFFIETESERLRERENVYGSDKRTCVLTR